MPPTSILFYSPSGPWWQRFADDAICEFTDSPYCHCAARVGGLVYEAVSTGVRVRLYEPFGADKDAEEVPHALNVAFLEAQVGKRYNFRALAEDVASEMLPPSVHIIDASQGIDDCSLYVAEAAGLAVQDYALRGPVTPGQVFEIVTGEKVTHGD